MTRTNSDIQSQLAGLEKLQPQLHGQDFLLTTNKRREDLDAVIRVAEILERLHADNVGARVFDSGLAISIFRDQSTRTRFSYASAASQLGPQLAELDEKKTQVAHGETVRETANMISFLTECIGIRDDMYIGKGHTYMKEVGTALDEGFAEGTDLALGLATVGLLGGLLIGTVLINRAVRSDRITIAREEEVPHDAEYEVDHAQDHVDIPETDRPDPATSPLTMVVGAIAYRPLIRPIM